MGAVGLGMAALANKAGELLSILSFLSAITPKADTTQSIDLAMKIIAEVMAFQYLNTTAPGDGPQLLHDSRPLLLPADPRESFLDRRPRGDRDRFAGLTSQLPRQAIRQLILDVESHTRKIGGKPLVTMTSS